MTTKVGKRQKNKTAKNNQKRFRGGKKPRRGKWTDKSGKRAQTKQERDRERDESDNISDNNKKTKTRGKGGGVGMAMRWEKLANIMRMRKKRLRNEPVCLVNETLLYVWYNSKWGHPGYIPRLSYCTRYVAMDHAAGLKTASSVLLQLCTGCGHFGNGWWQSARACGQI